MRLLLCGLWLATVASLCPEVRDELPTDLDNAAIVTLRAIWHASNTTVREHQPSPVVVATHATGARGCEILQAFLLGHWPQPVRGTHLQLNVIMSHNESCLEANRAPVLCRLCKSGWACDLSLYAMPLHHEIIGSHPAHERALMKLTTPRFLQPGTRRFILIDADAVVMAASHLTYPALRR